MFLDILNGILKASWSVFSVSWWIIIPVALFFIFFDLWMKYVRGAYIRGLSWKLLEIKIPKENLKTPKAMEQIFASVHSIHAPVSKFLDKYWVGKVEPWISFEIVGYSGGVYFFVRTLNEHRNLVESAIYSQYPDAEIIERDDYVQLLPAILPNQTYDVWGAEYVLARENGYPLRTYPYFEAVEEEKRIDPLSSIAEAMSNLKQDEAIWIQILLKPLDDKWKKEGEELIDKLLGKKPATKASWLAEFIESTAVFLKNLTKAPAVHPEWPEKEFAKEEKVNMLQFLTPGQRDVIKSIEDKIAKIGFAGAVRFVYSDRRDSFTRSNVAAVVGALKQFNTQNLNAFRPNPDAGVNANWPFKDRKAYLRKRKIFDSYKARTFPKKFSIFNIEELATVYHFPATFVEAPLLRRLEAKKGEPPANLPIE